MKGIGLLLIPGGLLCKKEVLGQRFCGSISGIDVVITFPALADDSGKEGIARVGMGNQLVAPDRGTQLVLGEEDLIWGVPMMAPKMNSFVKCVMIELDCNESESNEIAQKLYTGVQDWTCSFKRFLQLLTKQQLGRKTIESNRGNNLQLLFDGKPVENRQPHLLHGRLHSENNFASYEEIKQAIVFASTGKELLLEYQMLLSAYNARKDGKNRQAIIDACSAAEICLVNRIECHCNQKGIAPELLIEKYRTLGERFGLVRKLDDNSPTFDFGNVIVGPRNKVVHNRDIYPTNECTDRLIEMVEKYLAHYHNAYY